MKRQNLINLLTMLISLISVNAYAHDIEVQNGGKTIYYKFINDNKELEVTYQGNSYNENSDRYSGDVVIPGSVTYQGNTYSVTSIGVSAFRGCTGLTSCIIPNNVTTIHAGAFYNCTGLTSVTIPNTVTLIDTQAFRDCTGLTSITIPGSVTHFGGLVFGDCSNLTSVTVESKTPIANAEGSFTNKKNATLYVPAGSKEAYQKADEWKDFKAIVELEPASKYTDEQGVIYSLNTDDRKSYSVTGHTDACTGDITILSTVNGFSVTSIGNFAFEECSDLTSITIPNSVTSIGVNAFSGCSSLTSLTIPKNVMSIGRKAFSECSGLISIIVDSENTKYDSRNNCNAIIETTANKLIKCTKNTIIPNDVTTIGESAFADCIGLTSIAIPNSVTSIGEWAFCRCSDLKSIIIPESVTEIGNNAFSGCSSLTSLTIPKNVVSIGVGTFYGCSGLTSINVDSENTKYDSRNNCNAIIEKVTNTLIRGTANTIIPDDVTSIGVYAFNNCKSLTSITIPNSVTYIANEAFFGCSGLTSITISENTTYIGSSTFAGCVGLTSLNIPKSVTTIGDYAFSGCTNVTSVTVESGTPIEISVGTFANKFYATLYVPAGSKGAYQKADEWKDFETIVEMQAPSSNIEFALDKVKAACVAKWDTNEDGELSYAEAAAVTCLIDYSDENDKFLNLLLDPVFTSFDEFQFFTGITSLDTSNGSLFAGCEHLTSISLPNSITSIGKGAFYECPLTSIHIPASVTNIFMGDNDGTAPAFNSQYLQTIIVDSENKKYTSPEGSNAIIDKGNNTLILGCGNTTIPSTVTTIGQHAFEYAVFPESKTSITLFETITGIMEYAFAGSNITSINLGDLAELTTLGDYAFQNCTGLTEATIPASIENRIIRDPEDPNYVGINGPGMGSGVFADCSNIIKIVSEIEEPFKISKDSYYDFNFCTENAVLYVPTGKAEAYATAGWEEYDKNLNLKSFRVITDGAYTAPEAIKELVYDGTDQKLIIPGTYRDVMMVYSLDGETYSTSIPTGKDAGDYTVYCRKERGESEVLTLTATIAAPTITAKTQEGWDMVFTILDEDAKTCQVGYLDGSPDKIAVDKDAVNGPVTIPETVEGYTVVEIGKYAFYYVNEMSSVTIPNTVTSIEEFAFSCCYGLTSFELPASITTIGRYTFSGCVMLSSITIPNSVTSIGEFAFKGCLNLTSVTVEAETPLTITEGVFTNISEDAKLYVPAGSKTDYAAAIGWKNFGADNIIEVTGKFINVATAGTLSSFISDEDKFTITDLTITGELNGTDFRLLRAMAGNDYLGNRTEGKLKKLDISGANIVAGGDTYFDSDRITRPEEGSFASKGPQSLSTQDNVIGENLFAGCTQLEEIKIPTSTREIGNWAFFLTNISSFDITENVTTVDLSFFQETNVSSLFIPQNVTSLLPGSSLANLSTINVDSDNDKYDSRNNCNAIIEKETATLILGCKNTTIPNGVISIGRNAFSHCLGINSINLPSTIKRIGDRAFYFSSITSIVIPASVEEIGWGILGSCQSLSTITVETGNDKYDSRDNCNAIIEKATNKMVAGCYATTIPATVTEIGGGVFENSYNLTLTIPSTITTIDEYAFSSGYNLDLEVEHTTPLQINENVFQNLQNSTLRVPAGKKVAYAEATGWKNFSTIMAGNEGTTFIATVEGIDMVFTILDEDAKTCQLGYLDGSWDKTAVDKESVEGYVTIPETVNDYTVVKIGKCALQNVNGMESVTIPNTVTSIDEYAFYGCYGLTSFELPANVINLGNGALSELGSLTSFSVAKENQYFDSRDNCNAIIEKATQKLLFGCRNTIIPSSVTGIGSTAFNLSNYALTIPSTITTIDDNAFGGDNLTLQVEHTTPLEINENVFQWLRNSTLRVPAGKKTAYAEATGWSKFGADNIIEEKKVSVEVEEAGTLADIISQEDKFTITDLTITGELNGTDFRMLREMAGNDYTGHPTNGKLQKLDLSGATIVAGGNPYFVSDGIYRVDGTKEAGKGEAQSLSTEKNVIGENLFAGCTQLSEVKIPSNSKEIGDWAFMMTNISSLDIPEGVEKVWSSFSFETRVSTVTIPSSVKEIQASWGQINHYLSSIIVDSQNSHYDSRNNCNAIIEKSTNTLVLGCKNTIIPDDTKIIGPYAFNGDIGESITLPQGLLTIKQSAFNSSSIKNIAIPASVSLIEDEAFISCYNLTAITVDASNATYESPEGSNAIIEKSTKTLIAGCKSTIIPSGVKRIDDNVFNSCNSLTSITIPASIEYIGTVAFGYCHNLTSVTVEALEPAVIDEMAFYGSTNATLYVPAGTKEYYSGAQGWQVFNEIVELEPASKYTDEQGVVYSLNADGKSYSVTGHTDACTGDITILSTVNGFSVTSIGVRAFYESGLTSIEIPSSVTLIDEEAFSVSSRLTSVTIQKGLTSIAMDAFRGCTGLTSIEIPNSVTFIGLNAFYDCTSLTSIEIPSSVTSINESAFYNCPLTSVTVKAEAPEAIGANTFSNRANATLYVPKGTMSAYIAADYWGEFKIIIEEGNPSVRKITVEEASTLPSFISDEDKFTITDLTITGELNGTDFRLLRAMAGNDYTGQPTEGKLEKLDLSGATIVAGGTYAEFEGNKCHLDKNDNNKVVTASISDFNDNSLPSCLFLGCLKLQEIKLPSSIVSIQTGAFRHTGLTSFVVPKSTETLGTALFTGCDNLISLDVESGNTNYWAEDNAIVESSTNRLVVACKKTTIPSEVVIIGQNAFYNSGETIVLPSNLIKIERSAFSDTSLKSIIIPAYVSEIEGGAFASCQDLIEISVDAENITYESPEGSNAIIEKGTKTLVAGCQSTVIPSDVTAIGAGAFLNNINKSFISIALPTSVKSIGREAFYSCAGLTSINLPASIEAIGELAFASNDDLTIFVESETPLAINENVFEDLSNSILRVPAGKKTAYAEARGWSKFGDTSVGNQIFEGNEGYIIAETKEGIEMMFTVLNESAKTCQVGYIDGSESKTAVDRNAVNGAVTIPEKVIYNTNEYTVVKIGKYAFNDVSGMTSVTIPNTVTTIEEYAFAECHGLTSVELPASVTSIGAYAFYGLSGVSSIEVAAGNPRYDSRDNCNAIIETSTNKLLFGCPETTIPTSVSKIGEASLGNIIYISSMPSSVTEIDDNAFRNSCLILQVDRMAPLDISDEAFAGVNQSILRVPAGSKAAYAEATGWSKFNDKSEKNQIFEGNEGNTFTDKTKEGWDMLFTILDDTKKTCIVGNELSVNWGDNSIDRNVVEGPVTIPAETTNGYTVVKIGTCAFEECNKVTSISIPNTVAFIDHDAFYDCRGLTSLEIPASVTSIEEGAFVGLTGLTSMKVAEGNKIFDSRDNCNAIIETATNKLLYGCKNTVIPATVTEIGTHAFTEMSNYTIFIPSTITQIDALAFYGNNSTIQVESTTPPNADWAFLSLKNSTLKVPLGCKAAYKAAAGWNSFSLIEEGYNGSTFIAKTAEDIDMVFTILDNTAKTCQVGYLDGSESKTAVDRTAVNDAVTIPETVKDYTVVKIGKYAFGDLDNMTSVTIPQTVTAIDDFAFAGCDKLLNVHVGFETPVAITENVFTSRGSATLYVPAGTKATYKTKDYWKNFKEIIEEGSTPITDRLYSSDITAYKGTQVVLPIILENEQKIAAIQFNLQLPEGISVAKDGDDYIASLTSRASGLSISASVLASGSYRFVVVSSEGDKVTGTGGEVMNITLNIPSGATIGENTITLDNVLLTAVVNGEPATVYPENAASTLTVLDYTLGDVNDDSFINVVDVAAIAAYLDQQTPTAFTEIAADVNTDGKVDSKDLSGEQTMVLEAASPGTGTSAGQLFVIDNFIGYQGARVALPVILNNTQKVAGFQFDLQLPEGVSIAENDIKLASRANGLAVNTSALTSNTTRFVVVATDGSLMDAGEGEVMSIILTIAEDATNGSVTLKNAVIAAKSGNDLTAVYVDDVTATMTAKSFTLGDVNNDDHINVTDVVCVVDDILGRTPSNFVRPAADINHDDEVNVTDVMGLVDIILKAEGKAATRGLADDNVEEIDGMELMNDNGLLSLHVKDARNYVASQMEVKLGEGQTLEGITLNDNFKQTHQIVFARSGSDSYTVLIFSMSNEGYPAGDDELLKLNVSGGAGEIVVKKAMMVTREQEQKRMAAVKSYQTATGSELKDIYSLDGRLVKAQAKDTNGLTKGVYIIDGKKVVVK